MNAQIVELDASVHQKVQKLLPWAVLGKLPEAEQAMVAEHTVACAHCREDLEWQRKLQAVQPEAGASPDLEGALARLAPRLEQRRAGAGTRGWMRWALVAQLLVIAGLAGQVLRQPAQYRLLGAAATAGAGAANMIVVFKPDTSEGQLRAILRAGAARVVDGPTATGAWLLKVPPGALAGSVAGMRAHAQVQLAEALQDGAAQ